MDDRVILLVRSNASDEAQVLRALSESRIVNDVLTIRDGEEALGFLSGFSAYAGRDINVLPHIVLLDLKFPDVEGPQMLRRLRADARTRELPVVILGRVRLREKVS